MAAVNWFCLVLAFAFINNYVCIKVDPNGIPPPLPPNGNYTTISLNSQTILPYTKSTIYASNSSNEPRNNFTLLGDTELSASERTRRLIPYMAFYVPVSELPINKQYASKNNIHAPPKQQLARPTATGPSGGSHIPIPPQYVHSSLEYLPPGSSSHAGPSATASSSPSGQQYYQPNAGLGIYHSHGYTGGQKQQQQHPQQQQQQFHALAPITGHAQHTHIQPPGPPGPSATGFPQSLAIGHGKGNGNNNAFTPYKEIHPIRHKTVQHFPPLSSTASTAVSSPSSAVAYENVRQTSSGRKQQKQSHRVSSNSGNGGGAVYRPRTKQSKINLTPFTPSNSVPGNFVPIVYTPVNNNNNNNNNILNSQAVSGIGGEIVDSTSYNHEENQQYHKQHIQNPSQHHHHSQPQQIAIEYSSGPLPPSVSAPSIPIDVQPITPQHSHHHHLQQQQHQQRNHHIPNQQSQQQYYSVTTSPVNVDLTHDVVNGLGGGVLTAGEPVNLNHHSQHQLHPPSAHNTNAISPPPTIYHQNQQQQLQQQLQPEHVIIDASQQQTLTGIGSQQQHQQQQLYNNVGKSALQFQPPKPESFFDSEVHLQQQHHQQQNIEQVVLKDVNSNVSQMMTPQEKYVMYLQQRIRYNKHQQRQQATRQKYRERNSNNKDKQYNQQNPTQIFVLSSTMSPPPLLPPTHISPDTITALAPIRPSAQPSYDSNYPQHSPIHHDLYPRPIIKPLNNEDSGIRTTATGTSGGGSGTGTVGGSVDVEEQVLTIPVHSLFGEFDTLQQQKRPHNHYSQSHSASPSSSHHQHHSHKSQYTKNGAGKPQYIDYLIDEPKQSLDDEQHYQRQKPPQQLELLKPTLGPPSHAFILVTTAAPFLHEPVTQENYGSSLRPPYKNKPKIRLQPVLKENNVNYATIREQNPTERPQVIAITPTANKPHVYHEENDVSPKYVYVKEEFGQKLSPSGGGAIKLKLSNKYESDDNQIPQQHHHHYQQQEQQQQPEDNIALQPLATRQPATTHHSHHQQQELDDNEAVSVVESTPPKTILADPNELPDIRTSSLAEILHKLQESNHLPHTLTPDNIDNSIKTLIRILNNLKQTQTIVANPPQHHETPAHPPPSSPDYDYTNGSEEGQQQPQAHDDDISLLTPTGPNKHPGPSTGRPGIDYPNYAEIPQTSFDCSEQRYKGFFGDPETNCQVWHYCDLNGGKASFLCPNGTIFSQIALTCDWWFNVKCATTPQLYVLNERLYKYILPFTPKFPEDYSGPIVDKYLAMKFQEMEEKMRLEKEKVLQEEAEAAAAAVAASEESEENTEPLTEDSKEDNHLEETTTTEDNSNRNIKLQTNNKHESINSLVSEQSSERNLLIDDEVDNISQRNGALEKFESTTIASITATVKPDIGSFSLNPIIVSSTLGPDYDEDQLQRHDNEKRSHEKLNEDAKLNKTEKDLKNNGDTKEEITETAESVPVASSTAPSANRMHITVEKVDVIEIKPDGATGHLIRDMLMNSKQTK